MAKKIDAKEKEKSNKKNTKTTKKAKNNETTTSKKKTSVAEEKKTVKKNVPDTALENEALKEEVVGTTTVKKEKTKKNNLLGIILVVATVVLIAIAFTISINESSERSKYYKQISFSDLNEIIQSEETQIIYWASPSCDYCKQFKPVVMNVSYENEVVFNYLNVSNLTQDEYATFYTYLSEYNEEYGSKNLGTPSIVLFKSGKVIDISVGALTEDELLTYLTSQNLIGE